MDTHIDKSAPTGSHNSAKSSAAPAPELKGDAGIAGATFPTRPEYAQRPRVPHEVSISEAECEISYARSGGPGGQNVNKVETKAVLRWSPLESRALSTAQKELLLDRLTTEHTKGLPEAAMRLRNCMTKDGMIVLHDSTHRHREQNRASVVVRLNTLVSNALKQEKRRKKTKPSRKQNQKRLDNKKLHGRKKANRREGKNVKY